MAATSKRPDQNEIRKLMKEQRTKRIESPLAKYNSAGQLFCVICNQQVKSELVWPAHINGKAHKEKLTELKQKPAGPKPAGPTAAPIRASTKGVSSKEQFKRPFEVNSDDLAAKRVKVDTSSLNKIRASGQVQGSAVGQGLATMSSKAKKMALRKFVDEMEGQSPAEEAVESESDDDDDEDDVVPHKNIEIGSDIPKDALPSDFFDDVLTSSRKAAASIGSSSSTKLPEGFFDDPVVDARIRKAEPKKEKMEAEWDLFQKVIREATNVSEEQIAQDEQERMGDKLIEEIDEQIYLWSKVEELHNKKDKVVLSVAAGATASTSQPAAPRTETEDADEGSNSSSSDVDQAEFEQYLDWRSKKWRS